MARFGLGRSSHRDRDGSCHSSSYGGHLPITPYTTNAERRGPALANSLSEDNAEFGLGMLLSIDAQRSRLDALLASLEGEMAMDVRTLRHIARHLVPRSLWIVGGDGWAYDIGFGGLDHVLASHRKVNVLVLDTEVNSNNG